MEYNKRYLSPDAEEGSYGYGEDEVKVSPFNFGGNFGVTFLTKFEWINNGGKDGAEQEALDIVFEINKVAKNYRMFPVSKVYDKGGQEITDTASKEYIDAKKEAQSDFNARVTHILHGLLDHDTVKASLSRPFKNFKEYAQFCQGMVHGVKDFQLKPLDIFLQYQWQPSEGQNRTFLEIPRKMKYGAWLKPAQPGTWKEMRAENITDSTRKALWYINEANPVEEHPFFKNGWFVLSAFSNPVKGTSTGTQSQAGAAMNAGAPASTTSAAPQASQAPPPASAW